MALEEEHFVGFGGGVADVVQVVDLIEEGGPALAIVQETEALVRGRDFGVVEMMFFGAGVVLDEEAALAFVGDAGFGVGGEGAGGCGEEGREAQGEDE